MIASKSFHLIHFIKSFSNCKTVSSEIICNCQLIFLKLFNHCILLFINTIFNAILRFNNSLKVSLKPSLTFCFSLIVVSLSHCFCQSFSFNLFLSSFLISSTSIFYLIIRIKIMGIPNYDSDGDGEKSLNNFSLIRRVMLLEC